MMFPLKPPFMVGIFHSYFSHNQMVVFPIKKKVEVGKNPLLMPMSWQATAIHRIQEGGTIGYLKNLPIWVSEILLMAPS